MLGTKEHYDLMEQFERQFKHFRLDREKDREQWRRGNVYENGEANAAFLMFRHGYAFGRCVAHQYA